MKRTDDEETIANGIRLMERIVKDGPIREERRAVIEFEDAFRRMCRRMDRQRKKEGRAIKGDARDCQRDVRLAIGHAFRAIISMLGLDPQKVPSGARGQIAETATSCAAVLLGYREVIEVGGITWAYVTRKQQAAN